MNLKEMLGNDVANVFFNPDEFGEKVIFAGKELTAIKSKHNFTKKYKGRSEELGIYTGGVTYNIKKVDLLILIEIGEKVTIDGIKYEVIDIEDIDNIYKIDVITHRR